MKKSTVCLALLWMSGWISIAQPQEVMLSSFVPTPETANLMFATDEWLVWYTTSVVPGTENHRAQKYRLRFYINGNPGEPARFVYESISPWGLLPKGVLKNGTLVVARTHVGSLLLVKPDGTKLETTPRFSQFGGHSVSQVSDDGVLMQVYNLDLDRKAVEPVYFVPWSSRGVDFKRKYPHSTQTSLAGSYLFGFGCLLQ